MAHQLKNLDIPDDLYQELQKRAEEAQLPIEVELLNLAAAMLALNKTNDLTNELLHQIEQLSHSARNELFHSVVSQSRANELLWQIVEAAPGTLDQHMPDTLAIRGSPGKKRHALDILAEMPGHQVFQTAEDVDRYVREERESWEG